MGGYLTRNSDSKALRLNPLVTKRRLLRQTYAQEWFVEGLSAKTQHLRECWIPHHMCADSSTIVVLNIKGECYTLASIEKTLAFH